MLSDRVMLVSLNISQWTGRKMDKDISAEVTTRHGAVREAGNFTKKLISEEPTFKAIQTIATEARQLHYTLTLPYSLEGTRMLANRVYDDYTRKMRALRDRFDMAISDFIGEYPRIKRDARNKMGDMYNEDEFPAEHKLRDLFSWEVSIIPLPSGDQLDKIIGVMQDEIENIKTQLEEKYQSGMKKGFADLWERLYDVVQRASEKLNDPKAIFRDSLIGNIKELCSLLPKLNISDDDSLEKMRIEVLKQLCADEADDLRKNKDLRKEKGKAARKLCDAMGKFMGQ